MELVVPHELPQPPSDLDVPEPRIFQHFLKHFRGMKAHPVSDDEPMQDVPEYRDLRPLLGEIGRAPVRTPATNAHLVCRLLLEKKNYNLLHSNINITLLTTSTHFSSTINYSTL